MNIGIIGYGHLAKALSRGFLRDERIELWVSAPSLSNGLLEPRVHGHSSNLAVLTQIDCLILAVKPMQMAGVLSEIADHLPASVLIISVAAGLTLSWFTQFLPATTAVVRAMPNLASAFGQGVTPLIANAAVTAAQQTQSTQLFSHCGLAIWVNQEMELDIFTALSGSGLVYFWQLAQAMCDAAIHMGLSETMAVQVTQQTFQGAALLAAQPGCSFAQLQTQITSKAGTTAAALAVFAKHHFNDIVLAAMTASLERAKTVLK